MEFVVEDVYYLSETGLTAFEVRLPSQNAVLDAGWYRLFVDSIPRENVWIDGEVGISPKRIGGTHVLSTRETDKINKYSFVPGTWVLVRLERERVVDSPS